MRIGRFISLFWLLAGLAGSAAGQEVFLRFELPEGMCVGSRDTLRFGYSGTFNVVFDMPMATQSVAEQAFLPDGVSCTPHGCKYRSTLTFSDFADDATVQSAQAIKYVRLNMEHSFLGDLYISVVCPTGQRADIVKFSEYSSNTSLLSPCLNDIPASSRGWTTPSSNNNRYAYMGMSSLSDNSDNPCAASSNPAGTGWNYCWSNNSTSGYSYAGSGGYVYRTANQTYVETRNSGVSRQYYRVDSSNVAAGSNFYHPDQNFASLVGCPLNGEWYIEVIDGVKNDNGYIFDWELAMDPTLLPNHCALAKREVISPYVQRRNDSTYIFTAPTAVAADTTVGVIFRLINTCGDTIDSTAYITIHPRYNGVERDTACDRYVLQGHTYTNDATVTCHYTTLYGCDSTVRHMLKILRSSSSTLIDTVTENDLPYMVAGTEVTESVRDSAIVIQNAAGCDSTIRLTLHVWRNTASRIDTVVCRNQLPIEIVVGGTTYVVSGDSTISVTITSSHGADSVITATVRVKAESLGELNDTIVENQLPWATPIPGFVAGGNIDTTLHLTNRAGCDSLLHYTLHVWRNSHTERDTSVCENELPAMIVVGNKMVEVRRDTMITVTVADRHGADSVIRLTVMTSPYHRVETRDTVCLSQMPYSWEGLSVQYGGTSEATAVSVHPNVYDCDSAIVLKLTVMGEFLKSRPHVNPTVVTLENLEMEFHDGSRAATWREWTVGEYVTLQQDFKYTYPAEEDTIIAELIVGDNGGCEDTAQVLLQIDRSAVITPNAFTPTLETNNTWYVATQDIVELEVWIYNRNGNLVWHYTGIDGSWDGRSLGGAECPQGSYVYKARYRSRVYADRLMEKAGTILLIR